MDINNALYAALSAFGKAWNFGRKGVYLFIPGCKFIIPMIEENGGCGLRQLTAQKRWALRIGFNDQSPLGAIWGMVHHLLPMTNDSLGINIPFPKKSIDQLWHALVTPIDCYIPDSECYPFLAEEGDELKEEYGPIEIGSWYQGLQYEPEQQFGILAEGPRFLEVTAIIVGICALLHYIGLDTAVKGFIQNLSNKYKYKHTIAEINENQDLMSKFHDEISEEIENLRVTTVNGFEVIESRLGLRLVLR